MLKTEKGFKMDMIFLKFGQMDVFFYGFPSYIENGFSKS